MSWDLDIWDLSSAYPQNGCKYITTRKRHRFWLPSEWTLLRFGQCELRFQAFFQFVFNVLIRSVPRACWFLVKFIFSNFSSGTLAIPTVFFKLCTFANHSETKYWSTKWRTSWKTRKRCFLVSLICKIDWGRVFELETLINSPFAFRFYSIATQKKKVGSIAPKKFIARLRKEKEEFDNYMQQDAHEFLNFLINHINEIILAERNSGKAKTSSNGVTVGDITPNTSSSASSDPTWVHEIFQGVLTSETRCLNCETISSKDENFFDLQVDVDQNTSITHCLRCFSNTETLCSDNKFKCDNCCSYQEAQKRMRVKKLPMILALQLKRFKYMEQYNRHIKVSHRVVFPLELRLFNTVSWVIF